MGSQLLIRHCVMELNGRMAKETVMTMLPEPSAIKLGLVIDLHLRRLRLRVNCATNTGYGALLSDTTMAMHQAVPVEQGACVRGW